MLESLQEYLKANEKVWVCVGSSCAILENSVDILKSRVNKIKAKTKEESDTSDKTIDDEAHGGEDELTDFSEIS